MADKQIFVIAGPNGAGKTTFAMRYLQGEVPGLHFVNADLIAAGLSPLDRGTGMEAAASRLMLAELNSLATQGRSFAFETTLAGRGYLRRIDQWRRDGYRVVLVFLSLGSPEDAVRRVAQRVKQGGHQVPEYVVRRRFDSGLRNLREHYMGRANEWRALDNTGPVPLIAEQGMNSTGSSDIDQEAFIDHPPVLSGEELTESILRSLQLAAKDAHLLAYQTGTGVVTRRNGKVAVVPPDPALYEDLIPPPFQASD
ncbi:AAA family ATPase [Candidatus Poriferisocius sp.]|uniref:AAA family ATPase n=1 Tax=Candidatus Poriferisocius sp. TaxID=3101276 RepID=UPI003B5937AC